MGGHFAIGIRQVEDLAGAISAFGGRTICTVVKGGRPLREVQLSGRIGWIFGAEGAGVSPAIVSNAGERVTIPMAGGESLNVSVKYDVDIEIPVFERTVFRKNFQHKSTYHSQR